MPAGQAKFGVWWEDLLALGAHFGESGATVETEVGVRWILLLTLRTLHTALPWAYMDCGVQSAVFGASLYTPRRRHTRAPWATIRRGRSKRRTPIPDDSSFAAFSLV